MRTTLSVHRWFLACLFAFGMVAAPPVLAQVRVALDLPEQPLADSIRAIGQKTATNILFDPALTNGKMAQPIKGQFTAEEALAHVLANTDLAIQKVQDGTISVTVRGKQTEVPGALRAAQGLEKAVPQEGIVVTAQKRSELLIDVPQSVTVVSSDDLRKLGATQFRDFANTVPGLTFTTSGPGITQINLRGVTSGRDISSTVAIYVDDVPYGPSSAFLLGGQSALDVALFDLDRIEVLRGPQGTLYGSASLGGLIKYVSKRPDATRFSGDAQAGMSSTQHGGFNYNVSAAINTPIVTDTVALRASVFDSRDGGYIDNITLGQKDANRSDIHGGRADLLYAPNSAFTVRVSGFIQDISADGQATADYSLAGVPEAGSLTQRRRYAEPFDQHYRLVSATAAYDFGAALLTSISSYQTVRTEYRIDVSPVLLAFLTSRPPGGLGRSYSAIGGSQGLSLNKFTEEVRLASNGPTSFEWLLGAIYTRESSRNTQAYDPQDLIGQSAPNDLFNFLLPSRYQDYAVFGDLTYHLTEKFDVTGGLRYARNDQTITQIASGLFGASRPTRSATDSVPTYLANGRYHFSDHMTGYVRYATGYRPGGPNVVLNSPTTGLPLAQPTFEADKLKSYEIGIKSETADRRYSIDFAGYYIDWNNIQIAAVRSGVGVRTNAPAATVQGGELTVTARPANDLALVGAFSYVDAFLGDAAPDLGGLKGERLVNVPHFTASVNADYGLGFGSLRPTVGATIRYVSDRKQAFGSAGYRLPAYTSVDLRTGLVLGSVSLQLYVHNLLDKRGQFSEFNFGSFAQVAIEQPRTIGILATARF